MEPFADAVGLSAVCLSARMIDIVDRKEQLIVMPFRPTTELSSTDQSECAVNQCLQTLTAAARDH